VVVEGQDIPNEVMPLNASIDPSRLMVEGENLQVQNTNRLPPFSTKIFSIASHFQLHFNCNFFSI
jgi:hypothetical protein